jgi:hypothetical protein
MSAQDARQFPKPSHLQSLALAVNSSLKLASSLSEFLHFAKSALSITAAQIAGSLLMVAASYDLAAKISLNLRFSGSTKAALWPNNAHGAKPDIHLKSCILKTSGNP